VLRNARAQVMLMNPDPRFDPLRELCTELMTLEEANRHMVSMMAGLDVRYATGDHPLIGQYAPALPGLAERMRGGHWVFAGPAPLDGAEWLPWDDRILVRPDGYVAWVGTEDVADAMARGIRKGS
jgi:hypothetical protein